MHWLTVVKTCVCLEFVRFVLSLSFSISLVLTQALVQGLGNLFDVKSIFPFFFLFLL